VGPRAAQDAVARRKIPRLCRVLNPRRPSPSLDTILTELPHEKCVQNFSRKTAVEEATLET